MGRVGPHPSRRRKSLRQTLAAEYDAQRGGGRSGTEHLQPAGGQDLHVQHRADGERLDNGTFAIATRDATGNWVNAVNMNDGGTERFVESPWKHGYKLDARTGLIRERIPPGR